MGLWPAIRGVLVILSIVLVFALLGRFSTDYGLDYLKSWTDADIRGHGWPGIALYIGVGALLTGIFANVGANPNLAREWASADRYPDGGEKRCSIEKI